MTLNAMLSDLYRRLGFPSSPAAATTTRLTAFLNETQQEVFSEPGMEVVLRNHFQFSTAASTPQYGLVQNISRISHIRDITNRRLLMPLAEGEYRARYPSPADVTGLAEAWVDLGIWPVAYQPVGASELFIVSNSASDGATKSVTVEGYLSGGQYTSQTTTLDGVTSKSLSATLTTWQEITKFEIVLAAGGLTTATGTITLREDSAAGTILGQIYPGLAYAKYRRLALVPTPSTAVTYTVDYEREVTDMINATDEPLLPARFHRLLMTGARMKEYETTDNTRYAQVAREWAQGLSALKFWLHEQAAGSPNLRGGGGFHESPSRLGGWYPSVG